MNTNTTMPTREQMQRWLADLDAIRDELDDAGDSEMAELADRIDSIGTCLELRIGDTADGGCMLIPFPHAAVEVKKCR